MKPDFKQRASEAIASIQAELTEKLIKDANLAGWPSQISNGLRVVVDGYQLTIDYDNAVAEQIEDLEYGDGKNSPKPVMRRFLNQNEILMANTLMEASVDYLVEGDHIP